MVEREARCLALEQAYVHEVYHQMGGGDHKQHPPWPRITQFLNQLEQGSIVCDVDESFDAVLSIAVVHHFATTERRICAIKELARVLRIGAFYCDFLRGSCTRRRSKCKLHEVAPSPSSSSLSSPNESCYSFVRRALKKLAGVKRGGARSRPWFLESWTSCTSKEPPPRRYDPEGCEDIQDQPIELRRLEEDNELPPLYKRHLLKDSSATDNTLNQKSKSLTDIIVTDQKSMVRSQSSVPSLEIHDCTNSETDAPSKPRLIKQKKSVCEEDVESEERDKAMDMKTMVKSLPEFKISSYRLHKRGNVFKQSSMNEELMSAERLREKEKVRRNIQKQASLNEELIYNRNNKTLDSLRDSLFSTSTAKRFQIIKTGLTNKIKNSTTGIEKVAGASIKNGFVRILQNWTSGDIGISTPQTAPTPPPPPPPQNIEFKSFIIEGKKDQPGERRHSREDGSDSSKDSSLQSDTSVDSEDSFASVIFVPKSDVDQHSTNTSPTLQSTPASPQPTSPKIKFPPPVSPKMKPSSQMSFGLSSHPSSPKLKHPGQLLNSTTPTSPKMKYFPQPTSPRPYQANFLTSPTARTNFSVQQCTRGSFSTPIGKTQLVATKSLPTYYIPMLIPSSPTAETPRPPEPHSPSASLLSSKPTSTSITAEAKEKSSHVEKSPEPAETNNFKNLKPCVSPGLSPTTDHAKNLVGTKMTPIFAGEFVTSEFEEELANLNCSNAAQKETDGSSSSTVTSDSIRLGTSTEHIALEEPEASTSLKLELDEPKLESASVRLSPLLEAAADVASSLEETVDAVIQSSPQSRRKQMNLNSDPRIILRHEFYMNLKKEACGIEKSNKNLACKSSEMNDALNGSNALNNDGGSVKCNAEKDKRWDEECRQHLADFAEKLSEKLLAEIDRYREQSSSIQALSPVVSGDYHMIGDLNDPYLCKLSEDLEDLTKLSKELQERNEEHCRKVGDITAPPASSYEINQGSRVKCEGAAAEEKHIENKIICDESSNELFISTKRRPSLVTDQYKTSTTYLLEDQIPLLQDYSEEVPKVSQFIIPNLIETLSDEKPITSSNETIREKEVTVVEKSDAFLDKKRTIESLSECNDGDNKENPELSDPDSSESEGNWTDSRRNTILPNNKVLLSKPAVVQLQLDKTNPPQKEETTIIELLPAKDMPRRPSISIEMSEPPDHLKDRGDLTESNNPLHLGISLESSEAGDLSERTGSSSDGSRPSSRRETIQISESGSVLSLRPGLSIESSEAGDYSDKAGSDGSRDSRRDTVSFGDITSSSQNSLLRPGNSIESSDAGDVSDRTGSDVSRQNTSSAGKTPSTASFASDKASDCSKDARFADRRMARCDGRSSSEEMPLPRSCMNKLVRQRASTQEPNEHLNKAQSCETSLSGSTSQDSLLSDSGGGAITFHRYYHVFREGELDQLIERYVESLHIISSYYDHANWCVVAEKFIVVDRRNKIENTESACVSEVLNKDPIIGVNKSSGRVYVRIVEKEIVRQKGMKTFFQVNWVEKFYPVSLEAG
ncbi:unnamed protein product [Nesidiocoris tenuis]|uniref:Methyltransferase type 11 domain-containing protein n=1 Tax=Nesidiocoris tenuis TaxID=355587 RepID=A0A6H5GF84_9HEMI|nr:unnamed protein product [Nesidiocoris tenuis]